MARKRRYSWNLTALIEITELYLTPPMIPSSLLNDNRLPTEEEKGTHTQRSTSQLYQFFYKTCMSSDPSVAIEKSQARSLSKLMGFRNYKPETGWISWEKNPPGCSNNDSACLDPRTETEC